MIELPTGTVTFLFSDIEGSTRIATGLGADWAAVLSKHRRLLRDALAANEGVEVGSEGDSLFAVFRSASSAVAAARDGQRALAAAEWPPEGAIRVRIGLHTTDQAEVLDGTYAGAEVHRAARIMGSGHGGQIVVSGATRALLEGGLPDGVAILDLGPHRLKDFAEPEPLSQVCVLGLQTDFPPLRTLDAPRTNLPYEATTFIGREEEIGRVRELVAANRLVTLTGPGGTGKTRLSIRVASEEAGTFPDGVYFAALAPIREPELVLPAVARAVGLSDVGNDPIGRLAEHLAGKRVLLVLDNLEQVLAAAPDIGQLLERTVDVRILATSRGALRLYGEQEFGVPSLPMPDPGGASVDRSIARFAAPALFLERARRVKPDFEITDENAPAVAEICWRLDGLPLAIELAAARIRILTPQAMLARLSARLDLGVGGSRDLPERQRTLRGAIAWSYEILDEEERRFFDALSVFRGGADLESIEAVLGDYATVVLDAVVGVVDQSLVRQEELPDGVTRFRMLETIREFAKEQLSQRPDEEALLRRAHADHFLNRAERAAASVFGADQKQVLDAMEQDHDNLRAALAWATSAGEALLAMRFVSAAWRFWQMRGYLVEGEDRAKRVLAMDGLDGHQAELAAFLEAAGGMAYWAGEMAVAEERYDRALAIQRRIGDDAAVANALYNLSMSFGRDRELPIDLPPDRVGLAAEALAIYRRLGDRSGEGRALWSMMDMEILSLRPEKAVEIGADCLRIFSETGDGWMLAWTEYMLGLNEALRQDPAAARAHVLRALDQFRQAEDLSAYGLVLDALAAAAYTEGHREYAMRLAGAGDAIQRRGGAYLARLNRQWASFYPERLIEDPMLAAAWEEGRALPLTDALDLAVAGPPEGAAEGTAVGGASAQAGAARSRRGKTAKE